MDITTIMTGIAPGPDKVPGADVPVGGDLATLFAAVLSAVAEAGAVTPTTGVPMPTTPGGETTGGGTTAAHDAATVVIGEDDPAATGMPPELVALLQAAAQPTAAEVPSAPRGSGTAPGLADADSLERAGPATPRAGAASAGRPGETPIRADGSAPTGVPDAAVAEAGTDALQRHGEGAAAPERVPAPAVRDARPDTAPAPRDLTPSVPHNPLPDATASSTDTSGAPAGAPATTDLRLVERVMEAVELLENAPPPRRIRLEIGDLRLAVSLRADGVHVAIDGDSASAPTATWQSDLSNALEARGMSLADGSARDGGDRRERPDPERAPAPPTPRPGRRPSDDADRGLRI